MAINIVSMPFNEKLGYLEFEGSVPYKTTETCGVLDSFHVCFGRMAEHGKDVTACKQYQEKLMAYQTWFKRDRSP